MEGLRRSPILTGSPWMASDKTNHYHNYGLPYSPGTFSTPNKTYRGNYNLYPNTPTPTKSTSYPYPPPPPISSTSLSSRSGGSRDLLFEYNYKCSANYCVNESTVRKQAEEITRLREELGRVATDRDGLAIEVEQLKMEILAGELGRLDASNCHSFTTTTTTIKNKNSNSIIKSEDCGGKGQSSSTSSSSLNSVMGQGQSLCANGHSSGSSSGISLGCNSPSNSDDGQEECQEEGQEGQEDTEEGEDDVMVLSAHLIPQSVDDDVKLQR